MSHFAVALPPTPRDWSRHDCAVGETMCLTAAADSGYRIDEAEVIYWGTCPDCLAANPDSTGN